MLHNEPVLILKLSEFCNLNPILSSGSSFRSEMVTVTASLTLVVIPVTHAKMDILPWTRAITLGVKVNILVGPE